MIKKIDKYLLAHIIQKKNDSQNNLMKLKSDVNKIWTPPDVFRRGIDTFHCLATTVCRIWND